jgi:hypothetical protein
MKHSKLQMQYVQMYYFFNEERYPTKKGIEDIVL